MGLLSEVALLRIQCRCRTVVVIHFLSQACSSLPLLPAQKTISRIRMSQILALTTIAIKQLVSLSPSRSSIGKTAHVMQKEKRCVSERETHTLYSWSEHGHVNDAHGRPAQ